MVVKRWSAVQGHDVDQVDARLVVNVGLRSVSSAGGDRHPMGPV
ncbi:hypothetical protein AB0G74_07285 [Streptomyces sp. NPDC020875]